MSWYFLDQFPDLHMHDVMNCSVLDHTIITNVMH